MIKVFKLLGFWIAVAMLLMGGTLVFVAVEQGDLGAKVVLTGAGGFMVAMGVVFLVDCLRDRRKGGQHVD